MKVTVLGASGGIGRFVVDKLLAEGHQVTAYVRRAAAFPDPRPGLRVVVGDLTDPAALGAAVTGSDAVISALGPSLGRPQDPQATPIADGHRVLIAAMNGAGVRRLVTLATPAVGQAGEPRVMATVLPPVMARWFLPSAYRDIVAAGEAVKASGLDWTIVRIINPNLRHRGRGYSTWLGSGPVGLGVSRTNAAACLADAATRGLFVGKMPIVFEARA